LSIVRSLSTPGAESTPPAPASEFALEPPDGQGIFSNLYDDRDGLERCLADRFDRYEIELCGSVAFFAGSTARAVRYRIRPWDPADHDQVIALIVGIQRGEFNLPITAADQPDLSDITGFYRAGGGGFWVARHHGSVVGTIAALRISKHIAVLRKMFVAREHRGASGPATTLCRPLSYGEKPGAFGRSSSAPPQECAPRTASTQDTPSSPSTHKSYPPTSREWMSTPASIAEISPRCVRAVAADILGFSTFPERRARVHACLERPPRLLRQQGSIR
jgi:hypothetical protein